ncbi:F-box/WD repeat-containing protein 4 [Anopheles arabiensis]|uniref:AGAP004756-PA n=1 Tax=Anopheles gambiae TaxID=7165 RepID=Q7Q2Q1_ANOGA|nr:F-box/WD repeat-containing protein 4 [Anopheles arabiensis]XP_318060.3 F-box/WD repeat-containing protein 4 [Anopheles gambiae]EAA13200.3 AGAP004756-PA [Anopheles gambiae str. PEST]
MRNQGETNTLASNKQLCDLDEYSLAHVFLFLNVGDLDRCVLVCKKFQHIIQRVVFPKKCKHALVTGSDHGAALSPYHYTRRKRVKLDENWRYGRYEERSYFHHNVMYISQLAIDKDCLYMTHGGRLQAHRRTKSVHMIDTRIAWMVGSVGDSDITSLAKKNNRFFAGRMDGKILLYEHGSGQQHLQTITNDIIKAVDFNKDVYAVTTKNESTYVFNYSPPDRELLYDGDVFEHSHVYPNAYETIKLNNNLLAVGKFHCSKKRALQLIDLYSCTIQQLNSPSTAVYDVLWKDEHCILCGNFDTTMRLVDVRTGNDEACWTDPYNASVYCLSYNGTYAVHCGMKYHYRTNLYDLRAPNRCVQMYFPLKKNSNFSPVYRIAADCSQMFVVTDHNLRILNFDADWAATKDYASI